MDHSRQDSGGISRVGLFEVVFSIAIGASLMALILVGTDRPSVLHPTPSPCTWGIQGAWLRPTENGPAESLIIEGERGEFFGEENDPAIEFQIIRNRVKHSAASTSPVSIVTIPEIEGTWGRPTQGRQLVIKGDQARFFCDKDKPVIEFTISPPTLEQLRQ